MKIAYIGTRDQLSEIFIERMNKEDHEVYFLSDMEFSRSVPEVLKHRFYRIAPRGGSFRKVMKSIFPDCIVFAGVHFMDSVYSEEEEDDVALLTRTLQVLAELRTVRVILLSSVQVYGNSDEPADEHHGFMPEDERGMRFARQEQLLEMYRRQYGLHTVVVRASALYSDRAEEGAGDFLSRGFADVISGDKNRRLSDDILQPLHVADFTDAIKRIIDSEKSGVYNASGSFVISGSRLYELIGKQQGTDVQGIQWEEARKKTLADNSLLKKELEWTDFRKLEEQFARGEITFHKEKAKKKRREKSKVPAAVRRTLENVVVFAAFFAVYYMSSFHNLFSQIDWLTIYVILISVFLGIRQSALAVILASAAYLFVQDLSIFEMTNFYSYAGTVLKIMEFVFLGLVVSYTADMLREDLRDTRRELSMLGDEHEELKKINEENVMIKNEYEERLLDSKSGFPKLYRVVSRLMVLQPDRIFMEIVHIIAQMIHTDTVAVYAVKEGSAYLRLINALNEASAQGGKSWDISQHPDIRAAMDAGELFQGDVWSGEPAVVLPILYQESCVAVILIRELPYTSQTLYYVNLMRTLSLLLRESVGRALDHEELVREEQYMGETDILKPDAFRRKILVAREKAVKRLAEYCVVQIVGTEDGGEVCKIVGMDNSGVACKAAGTQESGDIHKGVGTKNVGDSYRIVSSALRTTDDLGTDESGNLYVLLNNTGAEDAGHLRKRLEAKGVKIQVTEVFDGVDDAADLAMEG